MQDQQAASAVVWWDGWTPVEEFTGGGPQEPLLITVMDDVLGGS